MTTNEFRKRVAEKPNSEWLLAIQATIEYNHLNLKFELVGISAMYEFVLKQVEGWQKIRIENNNSLPDMLGSSQNHFQELIGLLQVMLEQPDLSSIQHRWQYEIRPRLVTEKIINNSSRKVFLYNCPEAEFLLSLSKFSQNQEIHQGALDYLCRNNLSSNSNIDYFTGVTQAYEFRLKDHSQIVERRNAEKSSISKIRTDFQNYLNDSEMHLVQYLKEINEKFNEESLAIDQTKKQKEELFDEWFTKSKTDFDTFDSETKQKIADNEKLYREKLSLEAPAQYWNKRGQKLKTEARWTLGGLLLLVAIASFTLYCLLWKTPEGMLLSLFKGDAVAVKWSLIFVTFLSFMAYGIRVLAKITFSSFHLSRDAEEREQLTYVYLALKKDTSIDPEERKLIMQSIFSRADTGLLKDDSSPTMPGTIAGKIFQG